MIQVQINSLNTAMQEYIKACILQDYSELVANRTTVIKRYFSLVILLVSIFYVDTVSISNNATVSRCHVETVPMCHVDPVSIFYDATVSPCHAGTLSMHHVEPVSIFNDSFVSPCHVKKPTKNQQEPTISAHAKRFSVFCFFLSCFF